MDNRLYERRKELGLTLEDVGNIVGVTKSTVKKWESGYIENMRRDKIALLAKALKVSPLYIMGIDAGPDEVNDENYINLQLESNTVEPELDTSCINPFTCERYSSFTGITYLSFLIVITFS